MKRILFLLLWVSIFIAGVAVAGEPGPSLPKMDSGDTAWLLISAALVMLMMPGLALFYGGLVRSKNVLGTIM
ncbi:MAG: ammonia channel protein, partial [Thermodesulfobacteriota bacterium]